jgi:hypothetical protein
VRYGELQNSFGCDAKFRLLLAGYVTFRDQIRISEIPSTPPYSPYIIIIHGWKKETNSKQM